RVARALTDPVDGALDLSCAGENAGERVRNGEAEVVVAVNRYDDVRELRHELVEPSEHLAILVRHRVADGVGNVDGGRSLLERDLHDLRHELNVGAAAVLRREL